jgi:lipopolysaccharide/colanic/teichoic acid biosynthesis glycosyltransferase
MMWIGWAFGPALVVFCASYVSWFSDGTQVPSGAGALVAGTVLTIGLSIHITSQLRRYDVERSAYISSAFVVAVLFLGLFAILLFARVYYSRSFLVTAFCGTLLILFAAMALQARRHPLVYAVLPLSEAKPLPLSGVMQFVELRGVDQPLDDFDGLIVDYEAIAEHWQPVVARATANGMPVHDRMDFLESVTGRVSLAHLGSFQAKDFKLHPVYFAAKRVTDVVLTIAALPVFLVLTLVLAVLIKTESPGPVFFKQVRVGQGGKTFTIYKFRTMRFGGDEAGHDFAQIKDPRVTRIGTLLRRTRLDELAQLINVIRGEMSLIGPRPEQVGFVKEFQDAIPFYAYRHLVKPGITGWAQVSHGYAACLASTREKLEYDLYYAKHCSLWLDLLIALRTVRTVLTGSGAR